jgi:hypothetical protein
MIEIYDRRLRDDQGLCQRYLGIWSCSELARSDPSAKSQESCFAQSTKMPLFAYLPNCNEEVLDCPLFLMLAFTEKYIIQ